MGKKIVGLLIVLLGLILFLSNFDIMTFKNITDILWACFLVLLGIGGLINKKRFDFFFGSVIILGLLLLISQFGIISSSTVWLLFWPIILIEVGISFLYKPKKKVVNKNISSYFSFFSGVEEKNNNKEYVSSDVTAIFGATEVDYRNIDIKDSVGYIVVKAIFGGATLIVPTDVKLIIQGTPLVGGVENRAISDDNAEKSLIINYTAIFGGIEIRN